MFQGFESPVSAASLTLSLFVCLQWGPALHVCYKRAVATANALVFEAGEYPRDPVCFQPPAGGES